MIMFMMKKLTYLYDCVYLWWRSHILQTIVLIWVFLTLERMEMPNDAMKPVTTLHTPVKLDTAAQPGSSQVNLHKIYVRFYFLTVYYFSGSLC